VSLLPYIPPVSGAAPAAVGALADQDQYARARAALTVSIVGRPVDNRSLSGAGRTVTYADVRSPQHFVSHPAIRDAVATSAVGIETAAAHLPGRQSYAGWDGEPGANAPTIGTY
jgi:hypothetical protein